MTHEQQNSFISSRRLDHWDTDLVLSSHRLICMYSYGIKGQLIYWFKRYLENRSQYVTYNEKRSDIKDVICGVPQGSILGPLLFLIYVNDVASVSSKLYYVLFEDDTNVFISGNNLRKLFNTLHIELDKLYAWLQSNKLTFNMLKTTNNTQHLYSAF